MPIGKGKVTILNERVVSGKKTTPIFDHVYRDNTSDLEAAELRARQQFAHISRPDDVRGKRTRRGSLDAGTASLFSGSVVRGPNPSAPGSSGGA